jgi:hypothetical protein
MSLTIRSTIMCVLVFFASLNNYIEMALERQFEVDGIE